MSPEAKAVLESRVASLAREEARLKEQAEHLIKDTQGILDERSVIISQIFNIKKDLAEL